MAVESVVRSEDHESAREDDLPYQVNREGTIHENGRVIGKTNNPRRVGRRLRRFQKLNRAPAPQG